MSALTSIQRIKVGHHHAQEMGGPVAVGKSGNAGSTSARVIRSPKVPGLSVAHQGDDNAANSSVASISYNFIGP